jgi:hypothetical protein
MRYGRRSMVPVIIIFAMMIVACKESAAVVEEEEQEYPHPAASNALLSEAAHILYRSADVMVLEGIADADSMRLSTQLMNASDLAFVEVHKLGYLPRTFRVPIMSNIKPPETIYPDSDKIFSLSDIEGNFNTLVNLLQQHEVIDQNLNWSYKTGHLVVIGDVFDRGVHVTEMLWLLYGLEQQAERAGGVVHLLLGNHEAMNMRGDMRYLEPKYLRFAELVKQQHDIEYSELYGASAELGKWLWSKNVIEKIGDQLYVHAGVSPALANSGLSLKEINDRSRETLGKDKAGFDSVDSLLWGTQGPFWYRGYFDVNEEHWGPRADQNEVDHVLQTFNASRIFVGHTHVLRPELKYKSRVCAIDVVPPKDHLISAPPWKAYGVLIKGSDVFLAEENGSLESLTSSP